MRERREKVRARGRGPWRERESVQGERVCTGGREFESETRGSQTRGSRHVDATNAGFETRFQVITREERGHGRGFRVALTREEHRRGHGLRVVLTREGHRRRHGSALRRCKNAKAALKIYLDAGCAPRLSINSEKERDKEMRE